MTDRERWIVYPLLFLALGAALRDKIDKQTQAKQIICEQLLLVDNEGRPAAAITGSELRFDLAGLGNGHIVANKVDSLGMFQRGLPVIAMAPQQGMLLQQLMQLLPHLQLTPVLPQLRSPLPAPGQDPPRRDEAPHPPPDGPADPQPANPQPGGPQPAEPAPAA